MKTRALMIVLALGLAVPFHAFAQEEDDEQADSSEGEGQGEAENAGADSGNAGENAGETKVGSDEATASDAAQKNEPRSWFFGPFGRYVIVPAFMLELFLEQAPTLGNGSVGIIADHRSADGPTLEIGLGYTGYGFDGPFQAKGDPETDTEWLESNLGLIHVTGSVLWHSDLSSQFTFEYGIGLDLGILTGSMVRTEAFKENGTFHKCPGYEPTSAYCEPPTPQNILAGTDAYNEDGAHYNVTEKRVPPIGGGFMLPHLALRWAPVPDVAIKLEAAYGIVQMWLGLSAAYAPNI